MYLSLKIAVRCMSCPILYPQKPIPRIGFYQSWGSVFTNPQKLSPNLEKPIPRIEKTNPQKPSPGSVFEVKPIGIGLFEKPIGIGFFQDRMLRVTALPLRGAL